MTSFTDKDHAQLQEKGIAKEKVLDQIATFKAGIPFVDLEKAAIVGDGISKFSAEEQQGLISYFDENSSQFSLLKFVAKLNKGKASVGLESVPPDHPFYNLVGSDNITVFYTDRYSESPLVVKGAGAGGEFTASGVFADIIKASQENGKH